MPSTAAPQPIGSNLPLASSLHKVSFRNIPQDEAKLLSLPAGVADQQNINYGFANGSTFEKPEHYLRFVEPMEADLKKQVEYDMDEQDKEWVDALNADRKLEQQDALSYEAFEIIVDRLEKEWFDLMKRVPPKPTPAAVGPDGEPVNESEDTACAICDDGECENSNAIVFCDGCNLAVHQDCYGIPYIPEGQWLCRKCTVSPDRAVSCILCPNEGGAFKQTTHGKWAHLLCAMWVPETGVSNPVYMEPIDSVERIPKARWKLQCYLCRHRQGACIQCDNKTCVTAFHVTCARRAGLLLRTERQRAGHGHGHDSDSDEDGEGGEALKAMCFKHLPKHLRQQTNHIGKLLEDDGNSTRGSTPILPVSKPASRKITIRRGANGTISAVASAPLGTKSARAYKKSYKAGPPLVPAYVIDRVADYVSRIQIRKKQALLLQIARFWSLKREARRGAPLLKRLHLEPWTATVSKKEQTEEERMQKLQFMLRLREDLEQLRMLAELVRKREQQKLRQVDSIRTSLLDAILFPFTPQLREALREISSVDRSGLFTSPVSRSEVPDYYEIIKQPMDWATISMRIDSHYYSTIQSFADDVHLVLNNAMLYNKPDTPYHRNATRIQKAAEPILAELRQLRLVQASQQESDAPPSSVAANEAVASELELEPPLQILDNLDDYNDEQRRLLVPVQEDIAAAPPNFIEDLIRQSHVTARQPTPPPPISVTPNAVQRKRTATFSESARPVKKARKSASFSTPSGTTSGEKPETPRSGRRSTVNGPQPSSSSGSSSAAELTAWDTFKRFEQGWILPEGSRRHGRTSTSHGSDADSRKRSSSSASKKLSSQHASSDGVEEASRGKENDSLASTRRRGSTKAENDGTPDVKSLRPSRQSRGLEKPAVKELETPSSSAATSSSLSSPSAAGTPGVRGSRRRGSKADETPSRVIGSSKRSTRGSAIGSAVKKEASNPSAGIDGDQTPSKGRGRGRRKSEAQSSSALADVDGLSDADLTPGTLVWAKVTGHPHYPAEIMDEEDEEEVPPDVVKDKTRAKNSVSSAVANNSSDTTAAAAAATSTSAPPSLHLIRFYGEPITFAWVTASKLRMLLEDEETDEKMLSAPKSGGQKRAVARAFQLAKDARDGVVR